MRRPARAIAASATGALVVSVALVIVLAPLPPRGHIATFSGDGHAARTKLVTKLTYRLDKPLEQITILLAPRLDSGYAEAKVVSGKSWAIFGMSSRKSISSTFSFGKTFQPGSYTIELTEFPGMRGSWRISIAQAPAVPWTSRLLWLFIALVAASGLAALLRRRAPDLASRKLVYAFRMFAFGLFLMLLYPIVHELGHTLALVPFGAADFTRADYIGLFGTPHSGAKNGYADLAPWKQSFSSIAGPLFPVLAGFVLMAVWKLRRKSFRNRPTLEAALLWTAFVMLFAQCFALLLPLGILPPDGDYNGYVGGFPGSPTLAKALLIAVSLACFLPSWVVLRRLVELGKELKRTSPLASSSGSGGPPKIDTSQEHGSTGV